MASVYNKKTGGLSRCTHGYRKFIDTEKHQRILFIIAVLYVSSLLYAVAIIRNKSIHFTPFQLFKTLVNSFLMCRAYIPWKFKINWYRCFGRVSISQPAHMHLYTSVLVNRHPKGFCLSSPINSGRNFVLFKEQWKQHQSGSRRTENYNTTPECFRDGIWVVLNTITRIAR